MATINPIIVGGRTRKNNPSTSGPAGAKVGTDIHSYIEYSNDGSRWDCWSGKIHLLRRYEIFGRLAGVRAGEAMFPRRGIPTDELSWRVIEDYYGDPVKLTAISAHEKAEIENYKQALKLGAETHRDFRERNDHIYISNPDWHSPGWLWCEEYDRVMKVVVDAPPCYMAVGHAMRGLEAQGQNSVRFIFFFDN